MNKNLASHSSGVKLTDAMALCLRRAAVSQAFGLQGGAVVHIFDSLERHGINVIYVHHEQAAALAAVAHAKVTGEIGCVVVTTGPGSTNAITGLLAAWQDSIPCIFISGQVRSNHLSYGKAVRQVGTQEANIVEIVKKVTKFATVVEEPREFHNVIMKALAIAKEGRPGPVWIDLPLNFQWEEVDLPDLNNEELAAGNASILPKAKTSDVENVLEHIRISKKPLFVLGYGVRLAGAVRLIIKCLEEMQINFVTTWTASDLTATEHELNLGIIGMSGQRGANKAMFESDLIICAGTHLGVPHTTTLYESYAPNAKKIIINIDADQLKHLNVHFDFKYLADLNDFFSILKPVEIHASSRHWNGAALKELNWYDPETINRPNSNIFIRNLCLRIKERKCVIVDGGGTALYAGFQAAQLNAGDRVVCSSAISSMGTGLAETVGAASSSQFEKYITVIGDGSMLMNVQDLQTIKQLNINTIIVIINNNGYLAIRQTQETFLEGRLHGTHPDWGLTMPCFRKIAMAFDIQYSRLDSHQEMEACIEKLVSRDGPQICEVIVDEDQPVLFKQGYRSNSDGTFSPCTLEEMYPFT